MFSGFGGFGAAAAPSANAFSNVTFTKSATEPSPKKEIPSFGAANAFSNVTFTKPTESESVKKENGTASKPVASSLLEDDSEKEYMASLTELNKNVSSWIADHVNKNVRITILMSKYLLIYLFFKNSLAVC